MFSTKKTILNTALKTVISSKRLLVSSVLISVLSITSAHAGTYHIVEEGETLTELSKRFGISVERLIEINEKRNRELVTPGTKIIVPLSRNKKNTTKVKKVVETTKPAVEQVKKTKKATKYRVQMNDTLMDIAQKYGITLSQLANANSIDAYDEIYYGDILIIPNVSKRI